MRAVKWVILNVAFAYIAYHAVTNGDGWQFNVFRFGVWMNFIATIVCILSEDGMNKLRKKGRPVDENVSILSDVALIVFLICNGWFFTSVLMIIQSLSEQVVYCEKDKKENESK